MRLSRTAPMPGAAPKRGSSRIRASAHAGPVENVALTMIISACSQDGSICAQAKGVGGSRINSDDVSPRVGVALSVTVGACCHDETGLRQADAVVAACCYVDDVLP